MKEWALITGASAGIGLELARLFAAGGHNVALVARNEERLAALAKELKGAHGIEARVIPADLSLPGAAAAVFERARELEIEVLANNAGVGHYGEFARTDLRAQTDLIQLNIGALVELQMDEETSFYFIGPRAGGTEVVQDKQEVLVITPQAPLGAQLMEKKQGDRPQLLIAGRKQAARIVAVG